jgi:hypothetical protein
MAIWSRLTGTVAGVAIGEAGAAAVEPAIEVPKQKAWQANQNRILDLGTLAHLVATGLISEETVVAEAARNGYAENRLKALIQLQLKAPGIAEALTLYRRNGFVDPSQQISETQLEHALSKAGLEQQYHAAIMSMVNLPLESAQLAQGIHRGYIAYSAPGFVAPPDTPGKVPFYPQTSIDALATAIANGDDAEQLQVLVGIAGLPLSLFEMLQLLNRDLVTEDDVKRAIANSNLQNQYMDVALELRRRLLTPNDYSELRLRGWITDQDGRDGAALSGMEPADADLLYHMHGRPLVVHQIQTSIARGGVYDDPMKADTPGTIRAELVAQLQGEGLSLTNAHAFVDAVQESNIQPQYYGMALANRYTYPSYFVIKPLVQSGAISVADATQIFENEGWPPDLATKAAVSFGAGTGATTNTHVKSAQTAVVAAAKKAYIGGVLTPADATSRLTAAGLSASDTASILKQWDLISQIEGTSIDTAGGTPH